MIRVGTAGWAIPRGVADAFPADGTGLARYAARFDAVEIDSSFTHPHRPQTYARWAASVPDGFRFAVKLPRAVTHDGRLAGEPEPLDRFLAAVSALGERLGPLLVQLPPSLAFDAGVAAAFFGRLREHVDGAVACEPRHPGWFGPEADALLAGHRVARVAADPARVPEAAVPGGWPGLAYWRLHGSPAIYRSAYGAAFVEALADRLCAASGERWCVFDNTASGAAAGDALTLRDLVQGRP